MIDTLEHKKSPVEKGYNEYMFDNPKDYRDWKKEFKSSSFWIKAIILLIAVLLFCVFLLFPFVNFIKGWIKPAVSPDSNIGNNNTFYNVVPKGSMGNGNTFVGATDDKGNTIFNKGGTAIGNNACAGNKTNVAIGAGANAGCNTNATSTK